MCRLILLAALLGTTFATAQGIFDPIGLTVLTTGRGEPLQTSLQPLFVSGNISGLELQFEFGFGTDEVLSPGEISDSFTVTIQDAAFTTTAVILVADAGGVTWAPPTPGALFLAPETIVRVPIAFPKFETVLAHQTAYAVAVPIPSAFSGAVVVYFDLFDNLNATRSLGWHSPVIVVPEPCTAPLMTAGLVVLLLRRVLLSQK